MKKLLFSLSLLASVAAFAGENSVEASAQVFGVLPVSASAQSVIVSVPWVASDTNETPIAISNIIKTANLTVNDTIKVWDTNNSCFVVWTLQQNSSGVKYWDPGTTITKDKHIKAGGSNKYYLNRGEALILTRAEKPAAAYTFYVYGQLSSASVGPFAVATGTAETPAYTLIAPPYDSDTNLNDGTWKNVKIGGVSADRIYVIQDATQASGMKFAYCNIIGGVASWGRQGATGWNNNVTVPAGRGCWYVSTGSNTNVTVTWPKK